MLRLFCFILLFINSAPLFSQFRLDKWKAYTSLVNVKDAGTDSRGRIWAATSGGIFVYDSTNGTYAEFKNVDGPISLEANAIKTDNERKEVIIGYADGIIEIASEDFKWRHITDIKYSAVSNPSINDILITDEHIYAATGFGLTILKRGDNIFVEDVRKFGKFSSDLNVNQIILYKGDIWAATEEGVARTANITGAIRNPAVWKNYSAPDQLREDAVKGFAILNDTLFIATNSAIYKYLPEIDSFNVVVRNNSEEILSLSASSEEILYTTDLRTRRLSGEELFTEWTGLNDIKFLTINGEEKLVAMTKLSGIGILNNSGLNYIHPNSPLTNTFSSVITGKNGEIWAATGISGKGISLFSEGKWTNFTAESYPELATNGYYLVSLGKSGKIYASSWGKGFSIIERNDTGVTINHFDRSNSPLIGFEKDDAFVVVGDIIEDSRGDAWIVNWGGSLNGPALLSLTKDGQFNTYENCTGASHRNFLYMDIDPQGTKWIGSGHGTPEGILFYNDKGTLSNTSDDLCGNLTTSSYANLLSNTIEAVAADHQGTIWTGSAEGVSQIINPHVALNSNPKFIIRKLSFAEIKNVTDIFVDALDNKWIATSKGIFVLNPDGSEIIGEANMENSPLPTNEVLGIGNNPTTGEMLFATSKGLYSAYSLSVIPSEEYDIICYPQPYDPAIDGEMAIEGLAADSELKILTTSGKLIRTLNTTGRKTVWNGRDESGNFPGSGVYIIIATSGAGDTRATGKFAIIRKK